jgi:hypothetical protein
MPAAISRRGSRSVAAVDWIETVRLSERYAACTINPRSPVKQPANWLPTFIVLILLTAVTAANAVRGLIMEP